MTEDHSVFLAEWSGPDKPSEWHFEPRIARTEDRTHSLNILAVCRFASMPALPESSPDKAGNDGCLRSYVADQ
jgi:hypothetical protein